MFRQHELDEMFLQGENFILVVDQCHVRKEGH